MSRTMTRRTVDLTAGTLRMAMSAELDRRERRESRGASLREIVQSIEPRRSTRPAADTTALTLSDIPRGAVLGPPTGTLRPASAARVPTETAADPGLSRLRERLGDLSAWAREADIDSSVPDALLARLDQPGAHTSAMSEEAERVEDNLLRLLVEKQASERLKQAVEDTLQDMGLTVDTDHRADGSTVYRGIAPSQSTVEVVLNRGSRDLEVVTDDPGDAVDWPDAAAGEICKPAVDLALSFHQQLSARVLDSGVELGRVESLNAPLRGAFPSAGATRRRTSTRRSAR